MWAKDTCLSLSCAPYQVLRRVRTCSPGGRKSRESLIQPTFPVKKLLVVVFSLGLLAVASVLLFTNMDTAAAQTKVVVYKSPSCGCCAAWVDHMVDAGFEVEVHDTDDMNTVKAEHGVTRNVSSCHTALIDGYVLEGHVPAEDVTRLLAERPAVLGLAVPGMPIGSPGMEQGDPANYDDYDVVTFDGQGRTEVFRHVTN